MARMGNNCQIPTPEQYVIQMLNLIKYKDNIFEKRVLENSCGEGNILVEIVKRYIKDARKQGKKNEQIIAGLENNIVAYETDQQKIEICIERLNKIANELGISEINWNIRNKDFLKQENDSYDFIIGNPPYITYHDLETGDREYLKEHFYSCSQGRFDYSYAFVEASVKNLSKEGKLVYLLPYSIMKNKFADRLREYISQYITKIYDYTGIKVFPEAITSSVVFLIENKKNRENVQYYLVNENEKRYISRKQLSRVWKFKEVIEDGKKRFGDYFEISNSVATLYNEAFLIKQYEEDADYYYTDRGKIEKQLVYPAVSMKNKGKLNRKQTLILFPYKVQNGDVLHYSKEEFEKLFPMAARYLRTFSDKLSNRKSDEKALWFEYGRNQAIKRVFGDKLIMPMIITKQVSVDYAAADAIPYAGYFIKCTDPEKMTLEQAKAILESNQFYDYVKTNGTPTTPTSYRISVNYIKEYRF